MSTDPRAGEEGGCEGASCWRRPFTVGLGVYERVVGEDGGAKGDRQGKRFFPLLLWRCLALALAGAMSSICIRQRLTRTLYYTHNTD